MIRRLYQGRRIAITTRVPAITTPAQPTCHTDTSGIAKAAAASAWRIRTSIPRYLKCEAER